MTSPALIEAHTRGPWSFDGPPDNHVVWSGPEERVCFMAHSNGTDPEGDTGKARLVAAAPELLEALKAALVILDELDEYQKRPESGSYDAECACCMGELFDNGERQTMDQIRAAIAKALGQ